jgi:hypothetical protein
VRAYADVGEHGEEVLVEIRRFVAAGSTASAAPSLTQLALRFCPASSSATTVARDLGIVCSCSRDT